MNNPAAALPDTPTLLITTLAMYQTEFWAAVGVSLRDRGFECAFLSFDDRSTEYLRKMNFEVFGSTEHEFPATVSADVLDATLATYGITDLNFWLGHERVFFGIRDSQRQKHKLIKYLDFANRACIDLLARSRRVILVQEVGGFLCVIASYFAARKCDIDNWFIEPSFFRGRLFFTRNTFQAPQPRGAPTGLSNEVREYLDNTLRNRKIVVPLKDSHQYSAVMKKILNKRNIKRLLEKVFDKHVLGKHQEFGHLGHHVRTHLRMLKNSLRLRGSHTALDKLQRFVYYPFHVPADMALTLRAPHYLDQLALIDYIARSLPHTHVLAVKEHPAMIGAVNSVQLLEILRRHDNVVLLPPTSNNYDVLGKAELVVSVNSKSGAEALLVGTPVIALGDSFYRQSGLVHTIEKIEDMPEALRSLLRPDRAKPGEAAMHGFFQKVWNSSFTGELFVANPQNAETFARSMIEALRGADTGESNRAFRLHRA